MTQSPHFVLCVDDDADDRELLCEIITQVAPSFAIVRAENGYVAYQYLLKAKTTGALPCLVILDINMPIMDGKQTLVAIKQDQELKDIPVVLFSTSKSLLDKLFCKQYGVELITKPTSVQDITTVVERMLHHRSGNA